MEEFGIIHTADGPKWGRISWAINPGDTVRYTRPNAASFTGHEPQEATAKVISTMIGPDDELQSVLVHDKQHGLVELPVEAVTKV